MAMSEGDKYIIFGKYLNLPKRERLLVMAVIDALINLPPKENE